MIDNRITITCAVCGKDVDRIDIERGVFDIMTMRSGTRVRVRCHGDMQTAMLQPKQLLPETGEAFRQGLGLFE